MGLMKVAADTTSEFSKYEFTKPLHNLNESVDSGIISLIKRGNIFRPFYRKVTEGLEDGSIDGSLIEKSKDQYGNKPSKLQTMLIFLEHSLHLLHMNILLD